MLILRIKVTDNIRFYIAKCCFRFMFETFIESFENIMFEVFPWKFCNDVFTYILTVLIKIIAHYVHADPMIEERHIIFLIFGDTNRRMKRNRIPNQLNVFIAQIISR